MFLIRFLFVYSQKSVYLSESREGLGFFFGEEGNMQQRLKLQQQQQALMQQALLQQQQMYHHPGMLAAAAMTQVGYFLPLLAFEIFSFSFSMNNASNASFLHRIVKEHMNEPRIYRILYAFQC